MLVISIRNLPDGCLLEGPTFSTYLDLRVMRPQRLTRSPYSTYILSLAIGKTVYRRCQVQGQRGTEGFDFKWAMINKLVDRRTDHDDRSRHKTVQPLRDVPQQSDTIIRRRYGKLAIYE